MDNLVSILKMPALNHDVKTKILRLIQNWALTFEGKPALGYVGEIYRTLQREGMSSVIVSCSASDISVKASRSPLETLPRPVPPWWTRRRHRSGLTPMFAYGVAPLSPSRTASTIVGTAVKSSINNVHPKLFRCPTSESRRRFVFVIRAITNCTRKLRGMIREYPRLAG